MTFLEHLCEALMGPPTQRKGRGETYWDCPGCGGSRFHTRPHKKHEKDRFSCWACGFWGDEWDLLRYFYPSASDKEQYRMLEEFRASYVSPTGDTGNQNQRKAQQELLKGLREDTRTIKRMIFAADVLRLCAKHRVDPVLLAEFIDEWVVSAATR